MVPIVKSSLAFLILFIWVLSFFLMSVAKVLSIKSLKKKLLSFIDVFYCLFSLCFISILCYILSLVTMGFTCSFLFSSLWVYYFTQHVGVTQFGGFFMRNFSICSLWWYVHGKRWAQGPQFLIVNQNLMHHEHRRVSFFRTFRIMSTI